MQFRHLEFCGALSAVANIESPLEHVMETVVNFEDALDYSGQAYMSEFKRVRFNNAMQYLSFSIPFSREVLIQTVQRCSLIHALYEVVSEGTTYEELSENAIQDGGLDDMTSGQENGDSSWCLRVRHYGETSGETKQRRYGDRTRSMTMEREALRILTPLLLRFGGKVDLNKPDVKIYIFDGMKKNHTVLVRRLVLGARVSSIAPPTRICETNTPLCPVAAFALCNVARLRPQHKILDTFAGSGAILLAASMIEPSCEMVGIEIAHNGLVNRDDIRKDFSTRDLTQPKALLKGDCTDASVRVEARSVIGDQPFDLIVTDPPYGIRESTLERLPTDELMRLISNDRIKGTPILKKGGRLVCFVPCHEDEQIEKVIPPNDDLEEAGLVLEAMREQPLNSKLSRWLVSFVCVK